MKAAEDEEERSKRGKATPPVHVANKPVETGGSSEMGASAAPDVRSSDDQQTPSGSRPRPADSPEPHCSICLGALQNRSFTDSCFHMFCFVCLQEWSKIKAECPLCKQPFKSIIHNVKSYNNYDQFYLERPSQSSSSSSSQAHHAHYPWNFDRSFRYRTTLTMGLDHGYFSLHHSSHPIGLYPHVPSSTAPFPSLLAPYHRSRYLTRSQATATRTRSRSQRASASASTAPSSAACVSSMDYRRMIYQTGRRVVPSGVRASLRRRTVSPRFFQTNPAQTHRLAPWLNRELNALLFGAENQVQFVQELIMDLVKRFTIDSEEFYEHVRPYILHNTRHFIHEFLAFARSPYTMQTYDTKAQYQEVTHAVASSASDSDSDVVVVDDDDAPEAGRPGETPAEPRRVPHPSFTASLRWDPNPLDAEEGGVRGMARSGWDSPTPGPSWSSRPDSPSSTVNVVDISDSESEASTIIDPTYVDPQTPETRPAVTARRDSPVHSDGEDVVFVSYDKPWEERSPIHLSSGSEEEKWSKLAKLLKKEHKKKKNRPAATSTVQAAFDAPFETLSAGRSRHRSQERHLATHVARSRTPHSQADVPKASKGSSRKSKRPEKRPKRKHHSEGEAAEAHSADSERKKHKSGHSSSSSKSSRKRSRVDAFEPPIDQDSARKRNKHKKKHKRNKEKKDKSERHHGKSSRRSKDAERESSSALVEERDSCKKHPSGHKKSSANGKEKEDGTGDFASLLSDSSSCTQSSIASCTSSSATTVSVPTYNIATSTASARPESHTNTSLSSLSNRITLPDFQSLCSGQMVQAFRDSVSGETQTSSSLSSRRRRLQEALEERNQACSFSNLDPMSWQSISRLAGALAAQVTMPGFVSKSNQPLVISSSDDSDDNLALSHLRRKQRRKKRRSADTIDVAKTVVVPCSSQMGVPTAAIDLSASPSATVSRPAAASAEEYIDVDSISSDESLSDSEVVDVESLEDSDDSVEHIISSDGQDTMESVAKNRDSPSVVEVSAEAPIAPVFPKIPTSLAQPHPFSIQSILNKDVFMGADAFSASMPGQVSASSSQELDLPLSFAPEAGLSQSQSRSLSSDRPTLAGYVSKLDQLLPQRMSQQPDSERDVCLLSLFSQNSVDSQASHEAGEGEPVGSQSSTKINSGQDDLPSAATAEVSSSFTGTAADKESGSNEMESDAVCSATDRINSSHREGKEDAESDSDTNMISGARADKDSDGSKDKIDRIHSAQNESTEEDAESDSDTNVVSGARADEDSAGTSSMKDKTDRIHSAQNGSTEEDAESDTNVVSVARANEESGNKGKEFDGTSFMKDKIDRIHSGQNESKEEDVESDSDTNNVPDHPTADSVDDQECSADCANDPECSADSADDEEYSIDNADDQKHSKDSSYDYEHSTDTIDDSNADNADLSCNQENVDSIENSSLGGQNVNCYSNDYEKEDCKRIESFPKTADDDAQLDSFNSIVDGKETNGSEDEEAHIDSDDKSDSASIRIEPSIASSSEACSIGAMSDSKRVNPKPGVPNHYEPLVSKPQGDWVSEERESFSRLPDEGDVPSMETDTVEYPCSAEEPSLNFSSSPSLEDSSALYCATVSSASEDDSDMSRVTAGDMTSQNMDQSV